MAKYWFPKLYFTSENKIILQPGANKTQCWLNKDVAVKTYAEFLAHFNIQDSPTTVRSVDGFHLVAEELYSEILAPYAGRYKFRKLYFKCYDGAPIAPGTQFTDAYQFYDDAKARVDTRTDLYEWERKLGPLPVQSAQGFWLVHERLYEEILKPFENPFEDR